MSQSGDPTRHGPKLEGLPERGIPPEVEDGGWRHRGYHTPRSAARGSGKSGSVQMELGSLMERPQVVEHSGTSHAEPCHVPQHPPDRPVVPPFPQSFMSDGNMEKFLDGYEKVDSHPKVLKSDPVREP